MKTNLFVLGLMCVLLAGCARRHSNGWYFTEEGQGKAVVGKPIVTATYFEELRLDSTLNRENRMVYVITGSLLPDAAAAWADATEKAVGQRIAFLYRGEIITAPQVNMRIDGGRFQISSPELSADRQKVMELYDGLKKEMGIE